MHSANSECDDCYYYINSICKKGSECKFRHNPVAKASTKICPIWANTRNCTVDCPMRHSVNPQKRKGDEFCYFETTEQGCTKPDCEFKHKNKKQNEFKSNGNEFYSRLEIENGSIQSHIDSISNEIQNLDEYLYYING